MNESESYESEVEWFQEEEYCWPLGPLLLTWFNFNPSMDK